MTSVRMKVTREYHKISCATHPILHKDDIVLVSKTVTYDLILAMKEIWVRDHPFCDILLEDVSVEMEEEVGTD